MFADFFYPHSVHSSSLDQKAYPSLDTSQQRQLSTHNPTLQCIIRNYHSELQCPALSSKLFVLSPTAHSNLHRPSSHPRNVPCFCIALMLSTVTVEMFLLLQSSPHVNLNTALLSGLILCTVRLVLHSNSYYIIKVTPCNPNYSTYKIYNGIIYFIGAVIWIT